MSRIKACSYCGVPKQISKDIKWNEDGSISQIWNPDHRRFFYESKGLDTLFRNLQDLVGAPIDRIVIEGLRKTTYDFMDTQFSGFKGWMARTIPRRMFYGRVAEYGWLYGLGTLEVLDVKRGEYIKWLVGNSYSPTLHQGDMVGIFNAVEGLPADIAVEERGGDLVFNITASTKPEEDMLARLQRIVLPRKPGKVSFERCPECGLPLQLKECTWNREEGSITDKTSGRNMSLVGPEGFDAIFRELEAELGEDIPHSIVEAQRQYVVEAFKPEEVQPELDNLVFLLALRGMGNLVHLSFSEDLMKAVVENADPALMVAGLLQGIFELATGKGSTYDYIRSDDGTITVTVKVMKAEDVELQKQEE
jgi:hypothetical protein